MDDINTTKGDKRAAKRRKSRYGMAVSGKSAMLWPCDAASASVSRRPSNESRQVRLKEQFVESWWLARQWTIDPAAAGAQVIHR